MVVDEVVARESLDRFGRAGTCERLGVRVAFAVKQNWHDTRRKRSRVALLEEDESERLLALALDFGLGERRVENQVGPQRDRRFQARLERVQTDGRAVEESPGVKLRAELFGLVADLQRGARRRAFGPAGRR